MYNTTGIVKKPRYNTAIPKKVVLCKPETVNLKPLTLSAQTIWKQHFTNSFEIICQLII